MRSFYVTAHTLAIGILGTVMDSTACSNDRAATPGTESSDSCAEHKTANPRQQELITSDDPRFRPQLGHISPQKLARMPHFSQPSHDGTPFRCTVDGNVGEWSSAQWLQAKQLKQATQLTGPSDLSGQLSMASYGSGIALALRVIDDFKRAPNALSQLHTHDAIDIHLWPSSLKKFHRDLGAHIQLGINRQLINSNSKWRTNLIRSEGLGNSQGYTLEAQIPLAAMTPLPKPVIKKIHYRIVLRDADEQHGAEPSLGWEGEITLNQALRVPEAVRRRALTRVCMAVAQDALWGYQNGWRCSVPYTRTVVTRATPKKTSVWRLSHARQPDAPRLDYLRERLIFLNFPGLARGAVALLDKRETIHSWLPLGVVGSQNPGNAKTMSSDAIPFRLPDGDWAVAITHAYPTHDADAPTPHTARCIKGSRVVLSIVALRNAPHTTPTEPRQPPKGPPTLEEIFRIFLADCAETKANAWTISKDSAVIRVYDRLFPTRPWAIYRYKGNRYRRASESVAPQTHDN